MKANDTVFSQLSLCASLQDELILLLLPLILFDVILIMTACKKTKTNTLSLQPFFSSFRLSSCTERLKATTKSSE